MLATTRSAAYFASVAAIPVSSSGCAKTPRMSVFKSSAPCRVLAGSVSAPKIERCAVKNRAKAREDNRINLARLNVRQTTMNGKGGGTADQRFGTFESNLRERIIQQ